MKQKLLKVKDKFTDIIASGIATWSFVVIYTIIMIAWIILHVFGILTIDSTDFIKYNLFLSWMAGIQASIVLMASNRQAEKDRKTLVKGIELDEQQFQFDKQETAKLNTKLTDITNKINKLEEILSLMEEEEDQNGK